MTKETIEDILGLVASEVPEIPSDEKMKELSTLVSELAAVRGRIERAETLLETIKKDELRLSTEVIPSKMDEIGVTKITLSNGSVVSYKPFYSGKIIPETEPEAFSWLEEKGHGGVIKGEATFPYRRGERDEVLKMLEQIKKQYGREANVKLSVHHSTLRALIREVIEEGETFPPDLFTVFIGRKTEIK